MSSVACSRTPLRHLGVTENVRVGHVAERLGNWAINHKVAGSIPGLANDVVSLGKALNPTCLGECPCFTLSRSG